MVADLLEYLEQWLKDNPGESVRISYKTLVEALECMKDTQG